MYTIRETSRVQVRLVVIGSWARHSPDPTMSSETQRNTSVTGAGRLLRLPQDVLRFCLCVHGKIEEADHHLFPALVPPTNLFGRIRVIGVVGRIVEVGRALDTRPFGQQQGLLQVIRELPIEALFWDPKQDL